LAGRGLGGGRGRDGSRGGGGGGGGGCRRPRGGGGKATLAAVTGISPNRLWGTLASSSRGPLALPARCSCSPATVVLTQFAAEGEGGTEHLPREALT